MSKAITETMIALRLVWLRVLGYFLLPFFTVLLAQTETWSDQTWNETGTFTKIRVLVIAILAGMGAFMAFLDQSLQRAREEVEKSKESEPSI